MFVLTVTLTARSAADRPALVEHLLANAREALASEPGCRRFDVATDPEVPEAVFLYEVYDGEAAFLAHKATPHYQAFYAAAGPLIAGKSGRRYDLAEPTAATGGPG